MAARTKETVPDSVLRHAVPDRPFPGALIVFSRGRPMFHPLVMKPNEPLVLGRDLLPGGDEKVSTRHVELRWLEGEGFSVKDLGSRNGTFLDGEKLTDEVTGASGGVLRLGQTLVVLFRDFARFTTGTVRTDGGRVVGPTMQRVLERVQTARREKAHLVLRGETGVGKELVAAAFHAAGPGPLVTFNCAHLQPGLAEARLFGTVRGAFSEARDTEGLFLQADGGVLFLDEVVELDAQVQAKLLRTLDSGEVQRVGEGRVQRVSVQVVVASHQRLQDRVQSGRFRQDLLFRLNQFEVELPPLRERLEEVPWLLHSVAGPRNRALHVSLVEEALLREWPGNVRELLSATLQAVSREQEGPVLGEHLPPPMVFENEAPSVASTPARPEDLTKQMVVDALAKADGNATLAAKHLGLHRTQLNRLRAKFGLTK